MSHVCVYKTTRATSVRSIAAFVLGLAVLSSVSPLVAASESVPNVVIIYGDDVGYGDVAVNGATKIPTPNIDSLAAAGLNFADGHCSASTCTPSRYSMLTGEHAFREHIFIAPPNAPLLINPNVLTLADLFKKANYRTGMVGKWHLGLGEKRSDLNGMKT